MQKKLYHFLIIYDKIKKGKTKEKSNNNQGRKKEKMKNKVASFIITIVMLLIIIVLGLFILFVWQEIFGGDDENIQVENYVSTYNPTSEKSVENSEKMTTPQIIKDKINQIINNSQTKTEEKETYNYAEVQVDKYFYNQLNDYSKIIYKAFEKNKEEMKTGTAQIELGNVFTDVLKTEGGDKKLEEYYQSAVETYLYDNPDVFYISASKLYLNIETTTKRKTKTYDVFINSGEKPNYFTDEFTTESQVKQAISQLEKIRSVIVSQKSNNPYYDIKMVHDYLIDNIDYDATLSKKNIYDIYGALIQKSCVCEGYAKAFKYLIDQMEIPCVMVIGQATNTNGQTENHAWNYVQIENKWYAIDCTWDDPVIIGNGKVGNDVRYRYFLRGSSTINKDHVTSAQFTDGGKTYEYPTLNVSDYR